jgi:mannose-6-phosphate isomerase-like protein (cupin superfamily)
MSNFHSLAGTLHEMEKLADADGTPLVRVLAKGEDVAAGVLRAGRRGAGLHRQPAHEEVLIVLDGEGDFRVGDEICHVRRGDFVFVPRDTMHGTVAAGSAPLSFLSIIAPRVDLAKDLVWEDTPPSFRLV